MSAPAAQWYFKNGEQISGPYHPEQLKQAVAAGVITAASQIRQGENGQWYTAWEVPGLLPKNTDAGQVAATTFNATKTFAESSAWKTVLFRIAQLLVVIGEVFFILALLFDKDTQSIINIIASGPPAGPFGGSGASGGSSSLWVFLQLLAGSVIMSSVLIASLETAINTGKMADYLSQRQ